jgi:hypothetical protein
MVAPAFEKSEPFPNFAVSVSSTYNTPSLPAPTTRFIPGSGTGPAEPKS